MRAHVSSMPRSWLLVLVALGVVTAGCAGDESVTATMRSEDRPASETTSPDSGGEGDAVAYCERAEEVAQSDAATQGDPAAALEALDSLASLAPAELADDFEVLGGIVDELSGLDEDDPASFQAALEIAFDPQVMAASEAISRYTEETCGLSLDGSAPGDDPFEGTDDLMTSTTTFDEGDPSDLHLEDVDAVKEAAQGETWPEKLSGTMISMGTDVQLSAGSDQSITPEEALLACNTMWVALSQKNPAVSVQILSGGVPVAASAPGGPCSLV
jgi:hypothetical protein